MTSNAPDVTTITVSNTQWTFVNHHTTNIPPHTTCYLQKRQQRGNTQALCTSRFFKVVRPAVNFHWIVTTAAVMTFTNIFNTNKKLNKGALWPLWLLEKPAFRIRFFCLLPLPNVVVKVQLWLISSCSGTSWVYWVSFDRILHCSQNVSVSLSSFLVYSNWLVASGT